MLAEGTVINDQYRLDRFIAEGSFGKVFLATDLHLDRPVAVKLIVPTSQIPAENQSLLADYLKEARLVARLDHPHILGIHAVGQIGNVGFLVIPYALGGSFYTKLRTEGTLSIEQAGDYLRQISSALDHAHANNIVHRDLKPQNMLLRDATQAHLLIADFGIARIINTPDRLSYTRPAGTVLYMAPEQFEGKVGRVSDVYALGCILFEMLTGSPPYTGTQPQVMLGHIQGAIPSIVDRAKVTLPSDLQGVIEKVLAKKPEARFQTAGELIKAFAAALHDTPTVPGFGKTWPEGAAFDTTLPRTSSQSKTPPPNRPFSPREGETGKTLLRFGTSVRALMDNMINTEATYLVDLVAGQTVFFRIWKEQELRMSFTLSQDISQVSNQESSEITHVDAVVDRDTKWNREFTPAASGTHQITLKYRRMDVIGAKRYKISVVPASVLTRTKIWFAKRDTNDLGCVLTLSAWIMGLIILSIIVLKVGVYIAGLFQH